MEAVVLLTRTHEDRRRGKRHLSLQGIPVWILETISSLRPLGHWDKLPREAVEPAWP